MRIYVPSHIWLKYRRLWRNTKHTITYTHIISNEIRCCCEILCPRRQQSSKKLKKIYTVGDGYFMFRMHTEPMKPFQIESMSGVDPDILLRGGGSTTFQENLTRKNKKRKQQQQKNRTDREEEVVSAPCTHGPCPACFFGEGRKGRRHDLCVIVSPYIHKHISLTFQNVSMTEGGWVFLGSNGVILDNINRKMLFHKSQGWEVEFLWLFGKGTCREDMTVPYIFWTSLAN